MGLMGYIHCGLACAQWAEWPDSLQAWEAAAVAVGSSAAGVPLLPHCVAIRDLDQTNHSLTGARDRSLFLGTKSLCAVTGEQMSCVQKHNNHLPVLATHSIQSHQLICAGSDFLILSLMSGVMS